MQHFHLITQYHSTSKNHVIYYKITRIPYWQAHMRYAVCVYEREIPYVL